MAHMGPRLQPTGLGSQFFRFRGLSPRGPSSPKKGGLG